MSAAHFFDLGASFSTQVTSEYLISRTIDRPRTIFVQDWVGVFHPQMTVN
jgi:hypothetical protein